MRRRQLDSTTVFVKIFYNNKEITQTLNKNFNARDFTCTLSGFNTQKDSLGGIRNIMSSRDDLGINENTSMVISADVTEIPDSIKAEIYEIGVFGEYLLGNVYIPVPSPSDTISVIDREPDSLQFTGNQFAVAEEPDNSRWVSGILRMNVCWGEDENGKSLGPAIKPPSQHEAFSVDPLKSIGPAGLLSIRKLMDWIVDIRLDPNDPRNHNILGLKQLVLQTYNGVIPSRIISDLNETPDQSVILNIPFHQYWKTKKYFRVHLPSEFNETAEIKPLSSRNDKIFRRWNNTIIFKGQIPFLDEEIKEEMFEPISDPMIEADDIMKQMIAAPLSVKKSLGSLANFGSTSVSANNLSPTAASPAINYKPNLQPPSLRFLKQVRSHALLQRAIKSTVKHVSDYVREESLPPLEKNSSMFGDFFSVRRPLKPKRSETLSTQQSDKGSKMIIQIMRGINIPTRTALLNNKPSTDLNASTKEKDSSSFKVNSYIEVSFQRRRTRIAAAEGPNPSWNESITMDVISETNEFNRGVESMNSESDLLTQCVYFNLFDEIIYDNDYDDRDRERRINKRIERNWLGTFNIPFSTIQESARVFSINIA